MFNNKKSGFTIIELIIVVFVIGAVSSIVFVSLSSFRDSQILRSTVSDVSSVLVKAKQKTLSSVNSISYGVHFDSDKSVLFPGTTYSSTDINNETNFFNNAVSISIPSGLNIGGGNDVIFERLTGDTIGGTIKIQLTSNPSKYKIITISKTGIVSSN